MSFVEGLIATAIGIAIVSIVPKLYKLIKAKIKGEDIEEFQKIGEMNSLGFNKYRQWYIKSIKTQIKNFSLKKDELFGDVKQKDWIRNSLIKKNKALIKKYMINEGDVF